VPLFVVGVPCAHPLSIEPVQLQQINAGQQQLAACRPRRCWEEACTFQGLLKIRGS
jgi:hypothetical protein